MGGSGRLLEGGCLSNIIRFKGEVKLEHLQYVSGKQTCTNYIHVETRAQERQ